MTALINKMLMCLKCACFCKTFSISLSEIIFQKKSFVLKYQYFSFCVKSLTSSWKCIREYASLGCNRICQTEAGPGRLTHAMSSHAERFPCRFEFRIQTPILQFSSLFVYNLNCTCSTLSNNTFFCTAP